MKSTQHRRLVPDAAIMALHPALWKILGDCCSGVERPSGICALFMVGVTLRDLRTRRLLLPDHLAVLACRP